MDSNRCLFRVWAPAVSTVDLILVGPTERTVPLVRSADGYFSLELENIPSGSHYRYLLDGTKDRPDPASRFQPQGVHGVSEVIDWEYPWEDSSWLGLPLKDYIVYELHVGAFTQEGTFDAIVPHLTELKDFGITAIELMPVAQFPGSRNWGYDGVQPFAVQDSYGGPQGLKRLVNACHQIGLALILDVVYNHLGPEGNYLAEFGPYFTDRYKTPWGPAMNFDGPDSDPVRRYFIDNALYWINDFHFDALRLDAVHAILDHSPYTFLEQLAEEVHESAKKLNRQVFLFPESAANDSRLVRSREFGGYGLDAQWNDDFHHALRGVLTGERSGYYVDYGEFRQLVKAYREGFVYSGEYSKHRRRRHGTSTQDFPGERLVVFSQNHDQVGNRMLGERLSQLVSFEALKLAAGAVILSPFIPLLFMGEEYGEEAPFQYFISHSDPQLVDAVRDGRRQEFAAFSWQGEPPDPQNEATFLRAQLNHQLKREGKYRVLWEFYRELLRLRKELSPLAELNKERCDVLGFDNDRVLLLRRWSGTDVVTTIFNFNGEAVSLVVPMASGRWRKALDSSDRRWQGAGGSLPVEFESAGSVEFSLPPTSVALFVRVDRTKNPGAKGSR
ncbi:MAG: malto-oligosyltrehalose trehalohydrolase [Deltaproteobacteria bacterium]|nr:malto-oligosyltrehalose trehalohydrolase [Deltaproteobacteria bacterium]MDZ4345611.1 malto-oligosyltrehalose trehalohydrolase [Candidatus Binatia bacterium]